MSSLCGKCASIKPQDLRGGSAVLWTQSDRELSASATSCELCRMIYADRRSNGGHIYESGNLKAALSERDTAASQIYVLRADIRERGNVNMAYAERRSMQGVTLFRTAIKPILIGDENRVVDFLREQAIATLDVYFEGDETCDWAQYIEGRPIRAANDPQRAKQWLDACKAGHTSCRSSSSSSGRARFTPTRLIDVQNVETFGSVALVEAPSTVDDYVALSYRWGGTNILTSTTSNIDQHKKKIVVNDLCETIRDAVIFTRRLGFRYIWVDSLCILQDSRADWEREAGLMADVYGNAQVTLAAAAAKSGDNGLFLKRSDDPPIKFELSEAGQKATMPAAYCITNRKLENFEEEVSRGPLNTRAWVLQERVLSPRTIHFGKTQKFWECRQAIHWESRHGFHDNTKATLSKFVGKVMSQDKGKLDMWYQMLSDYTTRFLTKEDDKLPALRGLEKLFQASTQLSYTDGLWLQDLHRGLMWCASNEAKLTRPAQSRAPTWSWASRNGEIVFDLEASPHAPARAPANISGWKRHVSRNVPGRPFATYCGITQIVSGRLHMIGVLQVARLGPMMRLQSKSGRSQDEVPRFNWWHSNTKLLDSKGDFVGEAAVDNVDETPVGSQVQCLVLCVRPTGGNLLISDRGRPWTSGLLLRNRGEDDSVFERVGTFRAVASMFSNSAVQVIVA